MVLSVEGAGVVFAMAQHHDVLAEVDVGGHLGVNGVLSAVHEGAERLPVSLRRDFVAVLFGECDVHLAVGINGSGGIEAALKGDGIIMMRVVARA